MPNPHLPIPVVNAFLDTVPESHFFTVVFHKKDGTPRKMHCRRGVKAHLAGGKSTIAEHENLVGVYETNNDYRAFDRSRVLLLKGDHMTIGTGVGFAEAVKMHENAIDPTPEVASDTMRFKATIEFNYPVDGAFVNSDRIERRLMTEFAHEISAGMVSIDVEEVE